MLVAWTWRMSSQNHTSCGLKSYSNKRKYLGLQHLLIRRYNTVHLFTSNVCDQLIRKSTKSFHIQKWDVYCDQHACLSVRLSTHASISQISRVHTSPCLSPPWQRCSTLCIYLPDLLITLCFLTWALWRSDATTAALLQRRVSPNTPAAWYWSRPVLDDAERQI